MERFVLLLALLIVTPSHGYGLATNIHFDQSSLLVLKSHITSDPYNFLTNNWTTQNPFCSWIGVRCDSNLNRVIALNITNMGLVGRIPPEIGNLSFLVSLDMSENSFHGPIPPSIFNISSLEILVLRNNSLCSSLPVDMCKHSLHRLKKLRISFNELYGEIPSSLGKCSRLEYVSLGVNKLVGHVPTQIGNLSELQELYLGGNLLIGNIPSELFTPNIHDMALSNNSFEGPIPPQMERSLKLIGLDLSKNHLSGVLPSTIGNLSLVETLILHSIKLTGEIPSSICNLASLRYLHLSNNSLEGPIPQCFGNFSKSLEVLHLKNNHLNGLIPSAIFTENCSLESLNLNGNQFGGVLPRTLSNCLKLEVFDVGNNEIQDTFPFWMETLDKLRVLVLRSNNFHGTFSLPSKANAPFPKLQVFEIAHNAFTGPLPDRYLNFFRAMIDVKENKTKEDDWFSKYDESIIFVIKGLELHLERILATFTTIDMSENHFDGSIPESIGRLNSLRYLNLSHNNLTGHIPSSLGNMSMLESLDLSSNHLDGEIPSQLTSLTFLAKLNLSMNNLSGRIPQSPQLSENDAYVGNQGLCGIPLPKKCGGDSASNSSNDLPEDVDDDDPSFLDGFTWQVVAMGYGCGFLVGVGLGYLSFRYGKPEWLLEFFFGVGYKIKRRRRRTNHVVRRRT